MPSPNNQSIQPTINRSPRPQGLTSLSQAYNQDPSTRNKQKITNYVITHYLANQYEISGQGFMNPQQLAQYLKMPLLELNQELVRRLRIHEEIAGKEGLGQFARVNFFGLIFEAQKAISLCRNQAQGLLDLQGPNYVPFMTEQVNRALTNYTHSIGSAATIAKAALPANTGIQVINSNQQATVNNHIFGPDEAQKMVEEKTLHLVPGGADQKTLLAAQYDLQRLPEVRSNEQQEEALMAATLKKKALDEAGEMDAKTAKTYTQFEAIEDEDLGNNEVPNTDSGPEKSKPKPLPTPLPSILKPYSGNKD